MERQHIQDCIIYVLRHLLGEGVLELWIGGTSVISAHMYTQILTQILATLNPKAALETSVEGFYVSKQQLWYRTLVSLWSGTQV